MVARTAFVAAFVSRRTLMAGVSPLMALALVSPGTAFAQTGGAVRPDVPVQANTTTAQQAGTPQDQATAPSEANNSPSAAGEATTADIVVTGLRSSLQRNLDIKRTATGVVDAISAEDIGKFPDSNVAASARTRPSRGSRWDGGPAGISGSAGSTSTTSWEPCGSSATTRASRVR